MFQLVAAGVWTPTPFVFVLSTLLKAFQEDGVVLSAKGEEIYFLK